MIWEGAYHMSYINRVREQSPLVYNIMNEVGANFIANGLIAVGAAPSISNMPEEADAMARKADAVVLNIGTLSTARAEAMMLAGKAANEVGIPVLLDPIAIGATRFRTTVIHDILSSIDIALICANAGEVSVLGGVLDKMSSPDSPLTDNDPAIAEKVAREYETIVVSTGETDVITDGKRTTLCQNGHYMLQNITTSGCLLTSIVGAFAGVAGKNVYEASIEAVSGYGIAAERAMNHAVGPGSFISAFLDELYFLNKDALASHQRLEII